MRAILIEEKCFAEILELMKLKAHELKTNSNTPERLGWDMNVWASAVDEAHRSMHFYFVRWAQEHGASCVR